MDLRRSLAAEGIGTAFLLAGVVGSGIMGERLAGGNVAIALLANAAATAGVLYVLIHSFGPLSGAHFNPAVSVAMALRGDLRPTWLAPYIAVQMVGAIVGVAAADAMFAEPVFAFSQHVRTGTGQWLGEMVATFGLVGVIWVCSRTRPHAVAGLVAAYIGAAYWFTSSTSFANPAVTLARALTDTFAGIRPADVPAFLAAQTIGLAAAVALCVWLLPERRKAESPAPEIVAGALSPDYEK